MAAVAGFHPLIKIRRPDQYQRADNRAEKKRIEIENADNFGMILQFADIHETNHGNGNGNNRPVAAFEVPAFFIKPLDGPKANQCQKSTGPNADDAVIHT